MDNMFNDKAEAGITGRVYNYEEREGGSSIYLKDAYVQLKGSEVFCSLPYILIYTKEQSRFSTGSQLKIYGIIYKPETPSNPGQFNQKEYLREKNIYYTATAKSITDMGNPGNNISYSFRGFTMGIKEKLAEVYKNALPEKECGIVSAMLLGDKTLADLDMKNLYKQSGIGHLLAISGLHISILGIAVYKLVKWSVALLCSIFSYIYKNKAVTLKYLKILSVLAGASRIMPAFAAMIFILFYGNMTGPGISTDRAVSMMLLMLLAPVIYKSYDMLSALGASAVIILFQKPFAVFSCSFLLSYGAVLGIVLVYPVLNKIYTGSPDSNNSYNRRKKYMYSFGKLLKSKNKNPSLMMSLKYIFYFILEKTADLFLTSLSIQIVTLPVILYFYYEFPIYGIFINIIILPLMPLVVITSAAGGVAGLFSMPLAGFLLGSTKFLLDIYETVCRLAAKLPCNIVIAGKPGIWQIAVYLFIVVFALYIIHNTDNCNPVLPFAIYTVAFCVIIYTRRYNGVNITFLDTGQGDAIFIQDNKGTVYLVDGGSSSVEKAGTYRIIPFLKYNGIKKIDYIIITHPDEDHISGIREILEQPGGGIKAETLLVPDPASACKDTAYYNIIKTAMENNVKTAYIGAGDIISNNAGFSIKCLHPQHGFNAGSANAYSAVLSVSYGNTSFLLTGDIEGNGEDALSDRLYTDKTLPGYYNVLKVAHHGSKNSSKEKFLERAAPDISVISCGKNNLYGHPHKELIKRLENCGSKWVSTSEAGAVTVLSNGEKTTIKTYKRN
ncbi:MAG: DNA internalization-related competence protein ComEC/Rec2 [Lachnospiraceae bacterium]|nr:DNA internalization-related competence protein ComEC/Rec2 [Lachnospiraceae bacterium]